MLHDDDEMTSTASPLKKSRENGMETLFVWGLNNCGQLGLGNHEEQNIYLPKELTTYQNRSISDITCDQHRTVLVQTDGSVYSCGHNEKGELGHNKENSYCFERIQMLETQNIRKVACGCGHNVALTDTGQLLSWGENTHGQLGIGYTDDPYIRTPKLVKKMERQKILQVACGSNHSIALSDVGLLFTWGENQYGQLGLGQDTGNIDQPQLVKSLQGLPVFKIAAGGNHTFTLTVSGALFGWGKNNCGQIGVGDEEDKFYPVHVKTLRNQKVVHIACGEEHTLALTKEGRVFTFGSGKYGQLGHNSLNDEYLPRQVFELTGSTITQVACGRRHSIAYDGSGGKIYSFGLGANGQLGVGSTEKVTSPVVVKGPFVPNLLPANSKIRNHEELSHNVKQVFAGGDQCFVITNSAKTKMPAVDLRILHPAFQQVAFTEDTLRKFTSFPPSNKVPAEVRNEVEKLFSSPSCINASFLVENDGHYGCNQRNHGVNLEKALDLLSSLHKLPNHYIIEYVHQCLEKSLFPNLLLNPPDVEVLRLYLSLPLLSGFDNPSNFESLIVPFGKALIGLKDSPAKIVGRWWETLLPALFERLISIYKRAVVYILFLPSPRHELENRNRQNNVLVCMNVLAKLNKVNNENNRHCNIVNYDKFYIAELTEKIDIRMDYVNWIQNSGKSAMTQMSFCHFPFVFDAKAKTMLLHTDAIIQMQSAVDEVTRRNLVGLFMAQIDPVNPCLVLYINRDRLVHDTLEQLQKKRSKDFKKPLKVIFKGEDAVDEGGVRKEFFLLLLQEVLHPKFGMFRYYEDSRLMWFNESTFEVPAYFMMIGVLCGLAIYNALIIDLHFPLALYKKLLKRPVVLEDLKELQPSVGKSIESLLQYDGDDFVDTFCLTFEVTKDVFGEAVLVPLEEGGSERSVTKENRKEYIDAYIDYVFNKSVDQPFQAFYEGFHRVCGGRVLEMFHPQELQEMVVGNQNYDWEELEKSAVYKPEYHNNHNVIVWFWEVFKEMSEENKRIFLLFLTGSDRIPIHGMKSIKIIIQPVQGEKLLPVAHTCFNILDLPIYKSKDLLKKKLLQAVELGSIGFALV